MIVSNMRSGSYREHGHGKGNANNVSIHNVQVFEECTLYTPKEDTQTHKKYEDEEETTTIKSISMSMQMTHNCIEYIDVVS